MTDKRRPLVCRLVGWRQINLLICNWCEKLLYETSNRLKLLLWPDLWVQPAVASCQLRACIWDFRHFGQFISPSSRPASLLPAQKLTAKKLNAKKKIIHSSISAAKRIIYIYTQTLHKVWIFTCYIAANFVFMFDQRSGQSSSFQRKTCNFVLNANDLLCCINLFIWKMKKKNGKIYIFHRFN